MISPNPPPQQDLDFYPREEEAIVADDDKDEAFYLANRTFYTTCHKISRQNSPSYRKRPPYTFLENWLIHSVFSKSQQILLRFPVIHPRVMMTEGDFIYTPHQMANETTQHEDSNNNSNNDQYFREEFEDEDEDDYDYYDDTFVIGDEGVMMMSASAPNHSRLTHEEAPSIRMDENMWMGQGRSLTLHVANPDIEPEEEEEEDPMYRHVTIGHGSLKSNKIQSQLQVVKEEEEEEEEEETYCRQTVSLSPEVIHWYRSADQRQTSEEPNRDHSQSHVSSTPNEEKQKRTSHKKQDEEDDEEEESDNSMSRTSSASSYQSLADMIQEDPEADRCHERTITDSTYGTLLPQHNQDPLTVSHAQGSISPLIQVSSCLVDAAWIALDLAQDYMDNEQHQGVTGFIGCVYKIWKVLFSGAENMLNWGTKVPQAIV